MTKQQALDAWEKMYSEIDKDNYLFVGTINPEMVKVAIDAIKHDIVNRDVEEGMTAYGIKQALDGEPTVIKSEDE